MIGDFGWAEERAQRAVRDRLQASVDAGSVDGRSVALRELSGRVRAARAAGVGNED